MNLEFRAELFNAFNHAQFGQPDGNVDERRRSASFTPRIPAASCSSRSSCSSSEAGRCLQRSVQMVASQRAIWTTKSISAFHRYRSFL